MTRFTVPTLYEATYVLPKKRSENSIILQGSVDIDIATVDPDDAPIIHIVHDASPAFSPEEAGGRHSNPFGNSNGGNVVVRAFNGRYFASRWPVDEFVAAASGQSKRGPFEVFTRNGLPNVVMGMQTYHHEVYHSRGDAEQKFGTFRIFRDSYDQTVQAIHERCEDMIEIDGVIYELVGEPVLSLISNGNDIEVVLCEAKNPYSSFHRCHDNAQWGTRFGLDQFYKALSIAERMAAMNGGEVRNNVTLEQVSEWAVQFRGEPEQLQRVASTIVDWGANCLASLPAHVGLAWHDLATAHGKFSGITPPMLEALKRINASGSIARSHLERFSRNGSSDVYSYELDDLDKKEKDAFDCLRQAMELWDERENLGLEWVEEGLSVSASFAENYTAYEILTMNDATQISDAMGRSIQSLAIDAAAGKGHLILVDDVDEPMAAAFVAIVDGEMKITEIVTKHGAAPSQIIHDLILDHANKSPYRKRDLDDQLEALGI